MTLFDSELMQHGWAPGHYLIKCEACGDASVKASARATRCRACAIASWDAYMLQTPTQKAQTRKFVVLNLLAETMSRNNRHERDVADSKLIVAHLKHELNSLENMLAVPTESK